MNKIITRVKEIKVVEDFNEVNLLIEQNWILLKIVPKENSFEYSLGKINLD